MKQGKIKKQKPLPEISEEEKPFELPEGWEWVRVADLMEVINGRAYKKHEMLQTGTPLLRVGNLFTSNEWYYSDLQLDENKYINNGDLIYAWSASFGPFIWTGEKVIYHYHIWKLNLFAEEYSNKYFIHDFLLSITDKIKSQGNGIAMLHMTKEKMEQQIIALPPINEQQQIVRKIRELTVLCDQLEQQSLTSLDAHQQLVETLLGTLTDSQNAEELAENWARISEHFDTLFTTEASVDTLKQTILQLAVMGKLVPQDPNDEPASELLKRIAQEKAQLVKEGKIKKQKPLPPISDEEKPFELPEGWEWCRIDDLTFVSGGIQKQPKRRPVKNHFPYLRVANVQRGDINIDKLERFEVEPHELAFWSLEKNDILIVEGNGSADEIGRCAIWHAPIEKCVYQNHLIRVRGIIEGYQEFIALYLNSPSGTKEMQRLAVTTSGLYNLSVGKIRGITIPLPPLNQQNLILSRIREYILACENLKTSTQSAQQTQLHLADALTDAAIN